MRSHTYSSFRSTANRLAQCVVTFAAVLVLAACGGGGTTTDNGATTAVTTSNNGVTQSGLRALPSAYLTRRAVSYEPFRTTTQDESAVTDNNVKQDLNLIVAAGFGLIRTFASHEATSARILRLIKANNLDLKVHLGIYPNSFEYGNAEATTQIRANNDAEIARGVALANSYPDIVVAVSVGNETLPDWDGNNKFSSKQLASYIKTVRDQIVQPVTTDDDYTIYAGHLPHHPAENQISEVLAQIDFASIHTYPLSDVPFSNFTDSDTWPDWDWQQLAFTAGTSRATAMMDAALAKTQKGYALARAYMDSKGKAKLPIIIGETGWKAVAPEGGNGVAEKKFMSHPVNQKMYYDRVMAWLDTSKNSTGPKSIIYFEAFDEPWKGLPPAYDDNWGLFNVSRQARYVIQAKNAASATWVIEPTGKPGGAPYTDADALSWTPPTAKAAVEKNQYVIYADIAKPDPILASALTPDMVWDAFDGGTALRNQTDTSTSAVGDAPNSLSIIPNPASYGWGLLAHSHSGDNDNLANFASTGRLNFSIKTTYAGKMKIGISTDTNDRSGAESYVLLNNGDSYGYCNTGVWCNVSIPLSALAAINPKLDLRYVLNRFIISDKYADTGNTPGAKTQINIDNIYWSK